MCNKRMELILIPNFGWVVLPSEITENQHNNPWAEPSVPRPWRKRGFLEDPLRNVFFKFVKTSEGCPPLVPCLIGSFPSMTRSRCMWFELGRGALQGCDKREQSHNKANQVQEHVQQDHSEDSLILQTGATGSAVMDHTQQRLFHHPGRFLCFCWRHHLPPQPFKSQFTLKFSEHLWCCLSVSETPNGLANPEMFGHFYTVINLQPTSAFVAQALK